MISRNLVIYNILISFFISSILSISYDGYKTHILMPTSARQKEALGSLMTFPGIDFWAPPNSSHPTVMTSPATQHFFYDFMKAYHIPFNTTLNNVAESVMREKILQGLLSRQTGRSSGGGYLTKYLRYDEMISLLEDLTRKHKEKIKLEKIGKTAQGRDIYLMKISDDFSARKGVVMLEAGIHAREWAAPAMALHAIHQALQHPLLLKSVEWHVIPCANPDGYEYTHTTDRFWRKTRSRSAKRKECIGVDGNRNFGVHWAEIGSSDQPCSSLYQGETAFSEKETQAIRDATHSVGDQLKVYLSVHSFGSFILYPFGHSAVLVPDWKDLDKCGRGAANIISGRGGPNFTVGNTATVLYPSGGGSDDYARGVVGVKYAYTVELPGGGQNGFDLPPTEISKMVHDVFPGIVYMAHCWLIPHP